MRQSRTQHRTSLRTQRHTRNKASTTQPRSAHTASGNQIPTAQRHNSRSQSRSSRAEARPKPPQTHSNHASAKGNRHPRRGGTPSASITEPHQLRYQRHSSPGLMFNTWQLYPTGQATSGHGAKQRQISQQPGEAFQ